MIPPSISESTMGRPRSRPNKDLPPNLYRKEDKRTGKTYYNFRDPRDGKVHGFGTDKDLAVKGAIAVNSTIYTDIQAMRIASLSKPKEPDSPRFGRVILRHLELCEKRKLATNTLKNKLSMTKAWQAAIGREKPLNEITVRDLVETLEKYEDRPRMAQAMRSAAIDVWKDAMQEGWATDNLPAKTRAPSVVVQRSRLSLEEFQHIHAAALTLSDSWIARAMELAIVTAQRREDIAAMEFRQGEKSTAWADDDALCIIQQKTASKVRIPFGVEILGMTVGSVVKSCRDNIVSRWLIHHQRPRTLSKPGDQVWIDTITKGFARARDLAGVKGETGKTPPTFHELRSLSIRLYAEAFGMDFAQAIAGHKDASMTAVYRDVRGSEWVQVRV